MIRALLPISAARRAVTFPGSPCKACAACSGGWCICSREITFCKDCLSTPFGRVIPFNAFRSERSTVSSERICKAAISASSIDLAALALVFLKVYPAKHEHAKQ